jgi:hypothetical protein
MVCYGEPAPVAPAENPATPARFRRGPARGTLSRSQQGTRSGQWQSNLAEQRWQEALELLREAAAAPGYSGPTMRGPHGSEEGEGTGHQLPHLLPIASACLSRSGFSGIHQPELSQGHSCGFGAPGGNPGRLHRARLCRISSAMSSPEIAGVNALRFRVARAQVRRQEALDLVRAAVAAPGYSGPSVEDIEKVLAGIAGVRERVRTWQLDSHIRHTSRVFWRMQRRTIGAARPARRNIQSIPNHSTSGTIPRPSISPIRDAIGWSSGGRPYQYRRSA